MHRHESQIHRWDPTSALRQQLDRKTALAVRSPVTGDHLWLSSGSVLRHSHPRHRYRSTTMNDIGIPWVRALRRPLTRLDLRADTDAPTPPPDSQYQCFRSPDSTQLIPRTAFTDPSVHTLQPREIVSISRALWGDRHKPHRTTDYSKPAAQAVVAAPTALHPMADGG